MTDRVLSILSRTEVWSIFAALAGFLTLFWVIRGAPIGRSTREEPDDSPPTGYRDRVVAAAVIGFLLVLTGALVAATAGIPWSLPAFAAGFGTVLAVLRVNRRYRHASPTLRRVLQFSDTALTASLLAGVLVVGNVVAFKYGGRALDLTRDRAFSLSSLTVNQVRSLDRPLSFAVYFGNSERSIRQLDRVRQLLELVKAVDPTKVRVDYLDPFREAKEFEDLVRRIPDVAASAGDGIVLTYGEGDAAPHAVLSTRDLFEGAGDQPAGGGSERFVSRFTGEDAVTSALIRLRGGKRSLVAFTTKHGEPSTANLDPGQPGLGLWRSRLASLGADAVDVDLVRDDVPPAASLLVICGPKSPFQPGEIERIKQFIARDGQLILLVGNGDPTGLDDLLRAYNVELGPGQAVDPRYNYFQRPYMVYAPIPPAGNHPIAEPIAGRFVLLQNAAPINALGAPGRPGSSATKKAANPGVVAVPFLRTGPESWSEADPGTVPVTRDPARDVVGPLVVGVAVSTRPATDSEKPRPRLVVLSTPRAADNQVLAIEPTNLDLLMNAVYWLRGRPESLGIAAKTHENQLFAADPGLQLRLVMVPTLMAVVVIIGLGVTTYLARRD